MMPNFIKIGKTVAEIGRFNGFLNGGPTQSRICRARIWTTHEVYLVVFIVMLFFWNRCSTVDNMKVLTFCAFGLKTPIHAPKIGVFGRFDSLSREQY